jgi:hypothetical protein
MNEKHIAERVAHSVTAGRLKPGDYPAAAIVFEKTKVTFRIDTNPQRAMPVTGSQPYGRQPMKAIQVVLDLVKRHGVPEKNVDIIT